MTTSHPSEFHSRCQRRHDLDRVAGRHNWKLDGIVWDLDGLVWELDDLVWELLGLIWLQNEGAAVAAGRTVIVGRRRHDRTRLVLVLVLVDIPALLSTALTALAEACTQAAKTDTKDFQSKNDEEEDVDAPSSVIENFVYFFTNAITFRCLFNRITRNRLFPVVVASHWMSKCSHEQHTCCKEKHNLVHSHLLLLYPLRVVL